MNRSPSPGHHRHHHSRDPHGSGHHSGHGHSHSRHHRHHHRHRHGSKLTTDTAARTADIANRYRHKEAARQKRERLRKEAEARGEVFDEDAFDTNSADSFPKTTSMHSINGVSPSGSMMASSATLEKLSGDEDLTLEEVRLSKVLYSMFEKFLDERYAAENLHFYQHAMLYSKLKRPVADLIKEAGRIARMFILRGSECEVKFSEELKDKYGSYFSEGEYKSITNEVFAEPLREVRDILMPYLREWKSNGEWKKVQFNRAKPPPFNAMLQIPELSNRFREYLKFESFKMEENVGELNFCIEAYDYMNQKVKSVEPRRILEKYKGVIHYDNNKGPVSQILEGCFKTVSASLEESFYRQWTAKREWTDVNFSSFVQKQTTDSDGYLVPPTLAAVLTNNVMKVEFIEFLENTRYHLATLFVLEVWEFYKFFKDEPPGTATQKRIIKEAQRVYEKYIGNPDGIPVLPEMKKPLYSSIYGYGATSKITPRVFRKLAAAVFQVFQREAYREALGTYMWVDFDYDNDSEEAKAMEEEFSADQIKDLDVPTVPTTDDVLANENLFESFIKSLPTDVRELYVPFVYEAQKFLTCPKEKTKKEADRIYKLFLSFAPNHPSLETFQNEMFLKIDGKDVVDNTAFYLPRQETIDLLQYNYHTAWLTKLEWKKLQWKPSTKINFSIKPNITTLPEPLLVEREKAKQRSVFGRMFSGKKDAGSGSSSSSTVHTTAPTISVHTNPKAAPQGLSTTVHSTAIPHSPSLTPQSASSYFTGTGSVRSSESNPSISSTGINAPSLAETLESTYLRNIFGKYLKEHLTREEFQLWTDLTNFSTESVDKDLVGEADRIVSTYSSYFKNISHLKAGIAGGMITHHFFAEEEIFLYKKFYEYFVNAAFKQ